MSKRKKSRESKASPLMSRGELANIHRQAVRVCHRTGSGPGTEAYSLMCSAGSALGVYPRLRRETVERLRERLAELKRQSESIRREKQAVSVNGSLAPAEVPEDAHNDANGLPCCRCGEETPADDLACLYGGYWLCPRCVNDHGAVADWTRRRSRKSSTPTAVH